MRTFRASLAALSLALLPWLHGCRSAPPEPTPPSLQSAAPIAAPVAAPEQRDAEVEPAGQVVEAAPARRARPDDDSLLLGNPSSALSQDESKPSGADKPGRPDANNLANNLLVERAQHALSYNASAGGPNWVAWHVGLRDLGRVGRGTFRPDPLLPEPYQVRPSTYRGSGYDRGHLCPSADRTSSREANDATFVMSNMLPQAPALNQRVWAKLEDYSRTLARRGSELYTVAGGLGTGGRIGEGKINVPAFCWKIILVLPEGAGDLARINAQTRVITVLMPNRDTPEVGGARWARYLTSVAQIEKATGYKFFTALAPSVRQALKAKTDSGRASASDSTPGAGDEEPAAAQEAPAQEASSRGLGEQRPGRSQAYSGRELGRAPGNGQSSGADSGRPYGGNVGSQRAQTEPQPATGGQVWVNTNSGIYHYPGARWYGNTKEGAYMSEAEANSHGYRAAANGQ